MKKFENLLRVGVFLVVIAGFVSCGAEDTTTKKTDQSSAAAIKKNETIEMKNFKESLIQLHQERAVKQREATTSKVAMTTTLFNYQNESLILEPAKQLILSSGYKTSDLPSDSKAIIMMAMKVYADKTQIISNN